VDVRADAVAGAVLWRPATPYANVENTCRADFIAHNSNTKVAVYPLKIENRDVVVEI